MRARVFSWAIAVALPISFGFACGGADDQVGGESPDAGDSGEGGDASTSQGTGGSSSGGEPGDGGTPGDGGSSSGGAPGDGGSGGMPEPTSCDNSLDCVDVPGGPFVCNPATSSCVQCLAAADCEENHDCIANACVAYVPCVNSLDCPMGLVCDSGAGRCVECVQAGDCGMDETCVGGTCALVCESDRTCTPLGLLCDTAAGHCAECIRQVDCEAAEHCAGGVCRADVCDEGTSRCVSNAVVACSADGDLSGTPAPCLAAETCVEASGAASCEPWVCTPDSVECTSSTELATCSADGLSVVDTTDCAQTDQLCANGACSDTVCPPGVLYCQEGEVRQCSGDGSMFTVADVCLSSEYCDTADPACVAYACLPTATYCASGEVRECAANGQSFTVVDTCTAGEYCDAAAAACQADVCTQGEAYCASSEVRLCSADGSDYTVSDTCTQSEYCDAADPSCQPLLCTPNTPACNGNTATTCNAAGSGYVAGGTPCAAQTCIQGECRDEVLFEDFEDGNSDGWTTFGSLPLYTTVTASVVAGGADGTGQALNLTASGLLGTPGIQHTFPASVVTEASFWIRKPTTTSTTRFRLLSGATVVISVGLSSTGTIVGDGITNGGAYSANTWYHFEIRSINLAAGTYSLYVNNALVGAGTFTPPASGTLQEVELTSTIASPAAVSVWDEIVIQ